MEEGKNGGREEDRSDFSSLGKLILIRFPQGRIVISVY